MNTSADLSITPIEMIEISPKNGPAGTTINVIIRTSFRESLCLVLHDRVLQTRQVQVQGITSLSSTVPEMNVAPCTMAVRVFIMNGSFVIKTLFVSNFSYEIRSILTEYNSLYVTKQEHSMDNIRHRTSLTILGNIESVMDQWSREEQVSARRLVYFQAQKTDNVITCTHHINPVDPAHTVSCIFWHERQEYYITSVDLLSLAEFLLCTDLSVEEKNRIRRNLEGFRPLTVSKSRAESLRFFRTIMSYSNPKPRNIEKDLKVFSWRSLSSALKKIVAKYSFQATHGLKHDAEEDLMIKKEYDENDFL